MSTLNGESYVVEMIEKLTNQAPSFLIQAGQKRFLEGQELSSVSAELRKIGNNPAPFFTGYLMVSLAILIAGSFFWYQSANRWIVVLLVLVALLVVWFVLDRSCNRNNRRQERKAYLESQVNAFYNAVVGLGHKHGYIREFFVDKTLTPEEVLLRVHNFADEVAKRAIKLNDLYPSIEAIRFTSEEFRSVAGFMREFENYWDNLKGWDIFPHLEPPEEMIAKATARLSETPKQASPV